MRGKLSYIAFGLGAIVGLVAHEARAQNGPATSVQLPTFNMTGVSTTVLVPDRGQTFLGGIHSASSGASEFGVPLLPGRPFGNRATGSDRGATSFWARVWIHDFDAMDQMLLDQAAAQRGGRAKFADAPRIPTSDNRAAAQPQEPTNTLVDLLARGSDASEEARGTTDLQLARARELAAAGKPGVAKIYYQMALRRSTGQSREKIAAEMKLLDRPTIASSREN